MRPARAPAAFALALVACAGRCDAPRPGAGATTTSAASAAGPAPIPLAAAPLADAPTSAEPVRSWPLVALPEHCAARAPHQRVRGVRPTRLAIDPTSLGAVAFATMADGADSAEAATLLETRGAGAFERRTLPWPTRGAPLLARTSAGPFLVATALPGPVTHGRVALARDAEAALLGEGDGFEAIDLACSPLVPVDAGASPRRCALLTTRLAVVAAPGADVWLGDDGPLGARTRVAVDEATDGGHAEPVGFARPPDASGAGAIVVTAAAGALRFVEVGPAGATVVGTLPAPHGLLDAIATTRPIAMTYGAPHDEAGCAADGGRIRFERAGLPAVELRTPTPPVSGFLRRLGRGHLATWLAPLACGASRRVLFATVLDADGAPSAAPVAIADADAAAVATSGDDVDLWLAHDAALTWVRARCTAP